MKALHDGEERDMTTAAPEELAADLVRRQHLAVEAWRLELARRVLQSAVRVLPPAEQRHLKGWLRARAAVDACLAHQAHRGALPPGGGPRAVVVHREPGFRTGLEGALALRGLQVVGGGKDGAVAVGLAVVEQPDLLVVDDELPWLGTAHVLEAVRRYAPDTAVVVRVGSGDRTPVLIEAGAAVVLSRHLAPEAVAACGADLVSPALPGAAAAG